MLFMETSGLLRNWKKNDIWKSYKSTKSLSSAAASYLQCFNNNWNIFNSLTWKVKCFSCFQEVWIAERTFGKLGKWLNSVLRPMSPPSCFPPSLMAQLFRLSLIFKRHFSPILQMWKKTAASSVNSYLV